MSDAQKSSTPPEGIVAESGFDVGAYFSSRREYYAFWPFVLGYLSSGIGVLIFGMPPWFFFCYLFLDLLFYQMSCTVAILNVRIKGKIYSEAPFLLLLMGATAFAFYLAARRSMPDAGSLALLLPAGFLLYDNIERYRNRWLSEIRFYRYLNARYRLRYPPNKLFFMREGLLMSEERFAGYFIGYAFFYTFGHGLILYGMAYIIMFTIYIPVGILWAVLDLFNGLTGGTFESVDALVSNLKDYEGPSWLGTYIFFIFLIGRFCMAGITTLVVRRGSKATTVEEYLDAHYSPGDVIPLEDSAEA